MGRNFTFGLETFGPEENQLELGDRKKQAITDWVNDPASHRVRVTKFISEDQESHQEKNHLG